MDPDFLWGLLVGLLVGDGVFGHALRIVTLPREWSSRLGLAIAACVLYGIGGGLAAFEHRGACYIAIIGPMLGLTYVLVFTALRRATGVDLFQVVLGVPQVLAAIVGVLLLRGMS